MNSRGCRVLEPGKTRPRYRVCKFNFSAVCVPSSSSPPSPPLPLLYYHRRHCYRYRHRHRRTVRGAETSYALARAKKRRDRLIKQKMRDRRTRALVITANSRSSRSSPNQRALINRAIRQVTCERRAYPLSSGAPRVRPPRPRKAALSMHLLEVNQG